MKNKHVFLIFNTFSLGGVQKKMLDLANFITINSKKNIQVHLIFFTKHDPFFYSFAKKNSQFNLYFLSQMNRKNVIKKIVFILKLSKLIIQFRPILIISFLHNISPEVVISHKFSSLLIKNRLKLIISQDNILSLENTRENYKKPRRKIIINQTYNQVSKIITQTQYAKNDLIKNFKIKHNLIQVIPNWTPILPQSINKLQKNKRPIDVVYLGRFAQQKNLGKFIKIIKSVKKEIPQVEVHLYGSGNFQDVNQLTQLIQQNQLQNNIKLFHPTLNPEEILIKSKILLLTSNYEGQPMVMLEAMSLGCVIVATKYPGLSEYLNQSYGCVETTIKSAAATIIDLIKTPQKRRLIQQESLQAVNKNFSKSKLIPQTLDWETLY